MTRKVSPAVVKFDLDVPLSQDVPLAVVGTEEWEKANTSTGLSTSIALMIVPFGAVMYALRSEEPEVLKEVFGYDAVLYIEDISNDIVRLTRERTDNERIYLVSGARSILNISDEMGQLEYAEQNIAEVEAEGAEFNDRAIDCRLVLAPSPEVAVFQLKSLTDMEDIDAKDVTEPILKMAETLWPDE